MASINGVTIKAIKGFRDHEGCTIYQGNIYIDGKKAGFWSQDSWGGPDIYEFDTTDLMKRVKQYQEGFLKESEFKKFYNEPDCFLGDLCSLIQDEKSFKKRMQEGYKTMIVMGNSFETHTIFTEMDKSDNEFLEFYRISIDEAKNKQKDYPMDLKFYMKIYRNVNDFDLLVDKSHLLERLLTIF